MKTDRMSKAFQNLTWRARWAPLLQVGAGSVSKFFIQIAHLFEIYWFDQSSPSWLTVLHGGWTRGCLLRLLPICWFASAHFSFAQRSQDYTLSPDLGASFPFEKPAHYYVLGLLPAQSKPQRICEKRVNASHAKILLAMARRGLWIP